MNIPNIF
jgi:hypothetical protein